MEAEVIGCRGMRRVSDRGRPSSMVAAGGTSVVALATAAMPVAKLRPC
jgi:hypothetical protein